MNKKIISTFLMLILTLTGCIAAVPTETAELQQLRQQNQLLSDQLLDAQDQLNALSTQIAALETSINTPEPMADPLEGLAAQILPLLQRQDFAALASFISPERGVRISPYGYVDVENNLVFTREQVAALIHADAKAIIWTSGATESNNLAIKGVAHFYQKKGKHLITAKTEHKAVLDTCRALEKEGFEVTYLDPEPNGLIDLEKLIGLR